MLSNFKRSRLFARRPSLVPGRSLTTLQPCIGKGCRSLNVLPPVSVQRLLPPDNTRTTGSTKIIRLQDFRRFRSFEQWVVTHRTRGWARLEGCAAMDSTETAIDTTSRVCETQSGYIWYICTWKHPYYSGCCRVDPCKQDPIGCPIGWPASARGHPVATTDSASTSRPRTTSRTSPIRTTPGLTRTETAAASSSPSPSSTPTPGAGAGTTATISSTSTAVNANNSSSGITLSVGALVGIVVACAAVAVIAALSTCMWWWGRCRQRRDSIAPSLLVVSGPVKEPNPSALEPVFDSSVAHSMPRGVSDPASGMAPCSSQHHGNTQGTSNPSHWGPMVVVVKEDSMMSSPPARGLHLSNPSSDAHSSHASSLAPGNSWGVGVSLASSPSELGSAVVRREMEGGQATQSEAVEIDSRPIVNEAVESPRATLSSTQRERDTGTYANSWTRFQNLQL
ncbi:uncharacterized protein B0T15DRAFT_32538 [Chaetomium strumarium]|uniref:Uncharacterized protein n=1 Tax=Chaetomium strumarium TaxID=1170767 RepID=A0AAJ0H2F4_9PEZI|nr:hypothetical protein B0T15DRAFT_32538 [Chaetomium strumarium]